MKKAALPVLLCLLALAGCERVFTSSPFDFLQRDPASYSDEQALTYAEDALASGDETAMAAAFDLLSDSTDPETQLVAVELALGAAGVETALTELIAGIAEEGADFEAVLDDALDGFTEEDFALLVSAGALLDSAEDGASPSAEQYVFVAIGLMAAAADSAGGIGSLDPLPPGDAGDQVTQAIDFLDTATALLVAEGESTDILDGLTGLLP